MFGPPEAAVPAPRQHLAPGEHNWLVHRDLAADVSTLEVINDNGTVYLEDIDLTIENRALEWYSTRADDFLSASGETLLTRVLQRGDWSIWTVAHTVLTSSETEFHIAADLDAYEGDKRVFCHSWDVTIPRDFV